MLTLLLATVPMEVVLLLLLIIGVGFSVVYVVADQRPASPLCRDCHEMVGYSFCTICFGSGKREMGRGEFVDCGHHRGLVSTVVCGPCRLIGR